MLRAGLFAIAVGAIPTATVDAAPIADKAGCAQVAIEFEGSDAELAVVRTISNACESEIFVGKEYLQESCLGDNVAVRFWRGGHIVDRIHLLQHSECSFHFGTGNHAIPRGQSVEVRFPLCRTFDSFDPRDEDVIDVQVDSSVVIDDIRVETSGQFVSAIDLPWWKPKRCD